MLNLKSEILRGELLNPQPSTLRAKQPCEVVSQMLEAQRAGFLSTGRQVTDGCQPCQSHEHHVC